MYEKQNFKPGQKLKAAELNHMEDGIVNAVSVTEQTLSDAQKSQARKNLDLDDIADGNGIEEITIESVGEPKPNPSENVYQLNFKLDDGSVQSVQFTAPQGPKGDTGVPGAHIGPEAPTNGEKLWVDTDEAPEESETEGGTQIDVVAKAGQLLSVAEVDADGKPTKWQAVDLPKAETPDWNANEGENGYIEGRTHYVDAKGIVHKLDNKFIDAEWMATSREYIDPNVFIAEQKLTSGMWQKRQQDIQPGLVYDVHINDVVYPCEAFTEDGGVCIGNNTSLNKNNIPFCIYWAGGSATAGFFYKKSTLAYPIYMKVTGHSWTEYNKLPEEFLPDGVVKSVNGNKPDEKGNVTVEIPESTGGGVDVTASVGQTIIVEEVDASGKPTKWKAADYQPRTHWTEVIEILPETAVEVDPDAGMGVIPVDFTVEGGKYYTVKYNGVEYADCVCTAAEGQFLLGNLGAMDENFPITEHPFVVAYTAIGEDDSGNMIMAWVVVPIDGSTSITVSITEVNCTPIPAQYVINAFPYYIEVTGNGTTDDPYVCNDTAANVEQVFKSGRQIVLRQGVTDGVSFLFNFFTLYFATNGDGLWLWFVQSNRRSGNDFLYLKSQDDGTFAVSDTVAD